MNLFVSYSHDDEPFRVELEKHLSTLKREGIIEIWHDRKLVPGSDFSDSIDTELEKSEIVLLLISSAFLASDYCYEREMARAMERHDAGEAVVIPIIIRPCDWKGTAFSRLQALPKDALPVAKWENRDEAYVNIAEGIRSAARSLNGIKTVRPSPSPRAVRASLPTTTNLSIRKDFTDRDKDSFLEEGYGYIADFFNDSLQKLKEQNPELEVKFRPTDAVHFDAHVYKNGNSAAQCWIWLGADRYITGIGYSTSGGGGGSYNELLSVDTSDQEIYLKASMGRSVSNQANNQGMSHKDAAEYLWSMFIAPLQR